MLFHNDPEILHKMKILNCKVFFKEFFIFEIYALKHEIQKQLQHLVKNLLGFRI